MKTVAKIFIMTYLIDLETWLHTYESSNISLAIHSIYQLLKIKFVSKRILLVIIYIILIFKTGWGRYVKTQVEILKNKQFQQIASFYLLL